MLFNAVPSYLLSFLTHVIVVIVMALITISQSQEAFRNEIVATAQPELEPLEELVALAEMPLDVSQADSNEPSPTPVVETTQSSVEPVITSDVVSELTDPAPASFELESFGDRTAPREDMLREFGVAGGTGFSARSSPQRGDEAKKAGASDASELAVAKALQWLAEHQLPDGSFNFDHRLARNCAGKCGDPGTLSDCTTGSTGLALLPFLGAGQTHREGKYRAVVEKGLYYLVGRMKVQNEMGNLSEGGGNLYSHGICAIVLCEAYGMTHDKALAAPAQAALNYTMYAQDPVGGGWRYAARQAGDTSAVGWQLMALKSGHMAYLRVNPATVHGAGRFLDSVQSESGSKYGYTSPGGGAATTSIGLLSRMYLGWKKDNAALQRGVEYLDATGPSANNFYYNYYATQVMRHNGGETWKKWNEKMRDQLVDAQSRTGHATGSWFVKGGDHGSDAGGRLYCTAMATMILEVYYRNMPIYGNEAAEADFPL
jgi:hypothetical protein